MHRRPCWTRAVLINLLLLLVCYRDGQCCQRGFLRSDVEALVTPQVNKGQVILTVPLHDCSLERNVRLNTSDGGFEFHQNGSITATRSENIDATRKFIVWMTDVNSGEIWVVNILLKTKSERRGIQVIRFPARRTSHRQKREWISPPIDVRENEPPMNNPIAILRSDYDTNYRITYKITGPGADEPPMPGLFKIDPHNGHLYITRKVDREVTPNFTIIGLAYDQYGTKRETPIDLFINVLDINDNAPEFNQTVFEGSVEELSSPGTTALMIRATDKDIGENAIVSYRVTNNIKKMFAISSEGEIRVTDPHLDRETQDLYSLRIEARDLGGNINGLSTTATVRIKILDVNDNIPTMEKTKYEVTVEENLKSVTLLPLKVEDKDLEFTDNWLAHFTIIEGNEYEHFRIEVDNRTNEGILILQKELDFEEMEHIHLVIRLSNKVPYHHTVPKDIIAQPIDIKVIVKNVAEGIVFKPSKLVTKISESLDIKQCKVIGIYSAVSEDTGQPLEMTKYAKDKDVANWLIIDSETGKVTIDGMIDRESEYVIDGKYTATVLAISNERGSSVTATGTIVINVEDINDHMPKFSNTQPCMCSQARYLNVTAYDADGSPFGAPFHFNVQSNQMWKLGRTDATSMQLVPLKHLWPGVFSVPVWIEDADRKGHTVTLKVYVSDCDEIDYCSSQKLIQSKVELGGVAAALMILPVLLMLLLLPLLLLFCKCGSGFGGKNTFILDETNRIDGTLGQSSIEGGGQVDTLLPQMFHSEKSEEWVGEEPIEPTGVGFDLIHLPGKTKNSSWWTHRRNEGTSMEDSMYVDGHRKAMWDRRPFESWRTSTSFEGFMLSGASKSFVDRYINQKSHALAQEWISQPSDDGLLVYNSEGTNSPVGSLGCCSLIQEGPLDDSFLNDLDPKFKMLAGICSGELVKGASEVATSTKWEQKSSSQTLIQQKEVAKKEIVSSSITNQQPSGALLLPLKKHYVVTTTIEPSQEESLVVDEQSTVTSQYNRYQNVSITTDPAVTATTVSYGPGEFQGTVPTFTVAPVVQKNVVVTRSTGAGLGEIQCMATDRPIGQKSLTQKTTVVTSSVNPASEGVHDVLSKQMIGHVPVTQENLVVTGSGNVGLREILHHSRVNTGN
ncbi:desmoglein-2-like [Hypanus sabinus]|uniref:desmoglein-2-like n=1 Tax=Hypanus sabinus TaxID=79690 RepID=UPI0028C4493F|nr:desmoglein-2-like [Hypanus sabinus]